LINEFIKNYKLLCEQFIELLWDLPKVPSLVPKEITKLVKTDLSARIIQCAAKQASRHCSWNQKETRTKIIQDQTITESWKINPSSEAASSL
jgi:hypothetical protein